MRMSSLQTLSLPTREIAPPWKVATTETLQPLRLGSLSVTFAFGGSGPERCTALLPSTTVTRVTGTVRPFVIISAATGRGLVGSVATLGPFCGVAGAIG